MISDRRNRKAMTNRLYRLAKITAALLGVALAANTALAEEVAITDENWRFSRDTSGVVQYRGAPALSLYNATAWLENSGFQNGVIEFKVSFPKDRGFVGVKFRAQDEENFEHFYLRPHQSGMPDANQYTPVFNGNSGWQIYYGPRYSVPVVYPYGEWINVKLVVSGDQADIYINSDEPVLHVSDLMRDEKGGAVGFDSFLTQAFIADVRVRPQKKPKLSGVQTPGPDLPDNLVTVWRVSQPVPALADPPDEAALDRAMQAATWRTLNVEENGIANLGRIGPRNSEDATILARITVRAEAAITKRLDFGYSDKAVVFVNEEPVYAGDNTYRSRDYRYLGTVGMFDQVFVPLNEGENEIIFAVEESFGGWGLMAAFETMEGISIE